MTAAVLESVDQPMVLDEITIHPPRAGEVLVRVASCGVCHSDLSVIDGGFPAPLPVVLGHEATGVACVLGCAVQTGVGAVLNTAKVEEGATVAVLGAGGIGISVTQGAVVAGASTIVVVEPDAARREAALGFGATHVLDPGTDDVV